MNWGVESHPLPGNSNIGVLSIADLGPNAMLLLSSCHVSAIPQPQILTITSRLELRQNFPEFPTEQKEIPIIYVFCISQLSIVCL